MRKATVAALSTALMQAAALQAGEAEVVSAHAQCQQRVCRFEVTLRHEDTGWDHYANRWQVLSPDGEVLGTRELLHPHVQEQPFTRSLTGVAVPEGINEVLIRARDSVHGEAKPRVKVIIP